MSRFRSEFGAAAIEYAVLLGVILVVVFIAGWRLGSHIDRSFSRVTSSLPVPAGTRAPEASANAGVDGDGVRSHTPAAGKAIPTRRAGDALATTRLAPASASASRPSRGKVLWSLASFTIQLGVVLGLLWLPRRRGRQDPRTLDVHAAAWPGEEANNDLAQLPDLERAVQEALLRLRSRQIFSDRTPDGPPGAG